MKRIFLLAIFALTIFNANAQKDFQGMAVYESKTTTSDFKGNIGGREITPEMKKMFEERMKKALEKTFILNFDKSASIYKEEEKLETPGDQAAVGFRMMGSMMGAGGTYYKNVKDKTYAVDKEFFGKEFLVKDSLPKLQWKMEGESRMIGGYNCFKATAVKPVSASDLRNLRPKEVKESDKKDENKKTDFMDNFEMPKEITVTAWYTPEIPVNQGPEGYWGLPGLILEINDGKTIILCSKVVMNVKDKVEIKAPKNGKVVTQAEFDKIMVEKMEEFRNMRRGNGPGGNFRIER